MHTRETTLEILESDSPTDRVAVSMIYWEATGESRIRLRQESFSDAVGWFTQSQIDLAPEQVAQFKSVLGPSVTQPVQRSAPPQPAPLSPTAGNTAEHRAAERVAEEPAILKMPSVLAG